MDEVHTLHVLPIAYHLLTQPAKQSLTTNETGCNVGAPRKTLMTVWYPVAPM